MGRLHIQNQRGIVGVTGPGQNRVGPIGIALDNHRGIRVAAARPNDTNVVCRVVPSRIYIHLVPAFEIIGIEDRLQRGLRRRRRQAVRGIVPAGIRIHIICLVGIIHIKLMRIVAQGKRHIIGVSPRIILGHHPPDPIERIRESSAVPDIGTIRGRQAVGNIAPRRTTIPAIVQPHGLRGIVGGGPAQHDVGSLEYTAIVGGQRSQPEIGPALASLGGIAIGAQIASVTIGLRFIVRRHPRVAQVNQWRMVSQRILLESAMDRAPATHLRIQVKISQPWILELGVKRHTVGILARNGLPIGQFFPFTLVAANPGRTSRPEIIPIRQEIAACPNYGTVGVVSSAGDQNAVAQMQGAQSTFTQGGTIRDNNRAVGYSRP